jgi:hypothetical protein
MQAFASRPRSQSAQRAVGRRFYLTGQGNNKKKPLPVYTVVGVISPGFTGRFR